MIVRTEDDDERLSGTNNNSMHDIDLQRSYSIATGAQTISNKSAYTTSRPQSRHSFSSDTQVNINNNLTNLKI